MLDASWTNGIALDALKSDFNDVHDNCSCIKDPKDSLLQHSWQTFLLRALCNLRSMLLHCLVLCSSKLVVFCSNALTIQAQHKRQ